MLGRVAQALEQPAADDLVDLGPLDGLADLLHPAQDLFQRLVGPFASLVHVFGKLAGERGDHHSVGQLATAMLNSCRKVRVLPRSVLSSTLIPPALMR